MAHSGAAEATLAASPTALPRRKAPLRTRRKDQRGSVSSLDGADTEVSAVLTVASPAASANGIPPSESLNSPGVPPFSLGPFAASDAV